MSQVGQGLLYGGGGIMVLGIVLQLAVNMPAASSSTGEAPSITATITPIASPDFAGLVMSGRFD